MRMRIRMSDRLSLLVAVVLFCALTNRVSGGIGQLVRVEGSAVIHRGSDQLVAEVGCALEDEDSVTAAEGSKLVMQLHCGAIVHSCGKLRMRLPSPTSTELRYILVWNGEVRVVNEGRCQAVVQTNNGAYVVRRGIVRVNCNAKRTLAASETGYVETHLGQQQKLLTPGDWARCAEAIEYHSVDERFRPVWNVGPAPQSIAKKTNRVRQLADVPRGQSTLVSAQLDSPAMVVPASHEASPIQRSVPQVVTPYTVSTKSEVTSPKRARITGLGASFSSGPSHRGGSQRPGRSP